MKKIIFLSLMLIALMGHAQKNAVKLGLAGTQYGDFTVNYERVLTEKSSLNFNVGYWDLSTSFFNIYKYYTQTDPKAIQFLDFKGSMHFSLDYRTYLGQKGAMRGLYLAPYLRYWGQGVDLLDIMYSDEYEDNYVFDIDTKISSFGVGFQIGYQWIIRDQISIDFYFMGIGVERMTLTGKFTSNVKEMVYNHVTEEVENFNHEYFEKSVENTIKGINLISKKAKIEATGDYLLVKIPLWLPGIRTGFTIGYSF
ncbi:MAG: DUF3575 domain-containing protein [Prolixibacteraceae bacterium]|jgi:hypothetical protein|nr:DUF3575 domain-containing protein [Prolixibacteraceae bacterium]